MIFVFSNKRVAERFLARKPRRLECIDLGSDDDDNDGVEGKGKFFSSHGEQNFLKKHISYVVNQILLKNPLKVT